jgi:site-specific recombinase XerD
MKNDFAKYLTRFFTEYLSGERGASHNTIRSYGNTFTSFLDFMEEVKHVKPEKLSIEHITRDNVLSFLQWLQEVKQCSTSTRNQRLAAIHAFCKYLQYEDVIHLEQWQSILSVKSKKSEKLSVNYLDVDGIKLLLAQIPTNTREGRRDLAMIALLYDSGARVQELIDLTPLDIHRIKPYYITLFGKGRKKRLVPLQEQQMALLKDYMEENDLLKPSRNQRSLFTNNRGGKLSNAGITFILMRYVKSAHIVNPDLIPERISPHCLRHSKAMHLLQAGINLVYIRDILGHVSIQTTEIYARADSKQKREALEAAYIDVIPQMEGAVRTWEKDSKLKSWLKSLGK